MCNGLFVDGFVFIDLVFQLMDSVGDDGKLLESGGGERKGLVVFREESGNQSNINGSEIIFKF